MTDELKAMFSPETLKALEELESVEKRFAELATRTGENAQAFIQDLREIKIQKWKFFLRSSQNSLTYSHD